MLGSKRRGGLLEKRDDGKIVREESEDSRGGRELQAV